ncbi:uncharacterized protein [Spinacia oleracea]|uniref:Reverse transcriptase zinc-binding domain-containing protein n=1 Tax=Spinacia oleracea TaxID=3562 RepID=A0ABM3R8K2_SPIOL|nr:uncharacterized protein LOC130467455 [Spinacia oleracea]
MSIHSYWAQVFVLPKHVLHTVESICRAFLWQGTYFSSKPGYVAWGRVCSAKKEGGLGIRNVQIWNIAALGKYVWAIAKKQDSLWVRWVNAIYIKGGNWWEYQPRADSVKKVYQQLLQHTQHVSWCSAVWNRSSILKTRVICWLMLQGRLQTRTRLCKFGVCDTTSCLFCDSHEETHVHLFFDCLYSRKCLLEVKQWLGIPVNIVRYMALMRWIHWKSRGCKFQKHVMYAAINATVYTIWRARNEVLWNQKLPTVTHTVRFVQQSVIDRMQQLGIPRISSRVQDWWQSKMLV